MTDGFLNSSGLLQPAADFYILFIALFVFLSQSIIMIPTISYKLTPKPHAKTKQTLIRGFLNLN